jgi:F-type H+-transporting ATPase subunit delta
MDVVASRYAKALAESLSADGGDVVDQGLEQLEGFAWVLDSEPDARQILTNPVIPPDQREQFLDRLSGALTFDARVRKLIGLLVERRRLGVFDDVIVAYRKLLDEKKGIVRAVVTAAAPLTETERGEISSKLEASLGKRVVMDVRQDPELLGGLVVRIGSTVYDGTLRQHLSALKSRLISS